MDDWDRDPDGQAKVDAVLGFGWAIAFDTGVALRIEHVRDRTALVEGRIAATQLLFTPEQAEEVGRALIQGAALSRSGDEPDKPN